MKNYPLTVDTVLGKLDREGAADVRDAVEFEFGALLRSPDAEAVEVWLNGKFYCFLITAQGITLTIQPTHGTWVVEATPNGRQA